jgi:signal transduction histidine kinase
MTTEALSIEEIRSQTIRRLFTRTPKFGMLLFEPILAAFALYGAWTGGQLHRVLALGLLVTVVAVNLFRVPHMKYPAVRYLLTMAVVAVSGGIASPLLPFLLIPSFSNGAIFELRFALTQTVLSIVAVVGMAVIGPHEWTRAIVMVALLVGSLLVGRKIRMMSDEMIRASFEARDQLLGGYRERLRELHAIRGEMADALKNPLASIKGLVGLVALEPERARERLDVLQREVCRTQAIVEEYLSFARPLTPLQTERFCMRQAITDVAQLHEGMAAMRGVRLDLAGAKPIEIVGDRQKIRQMLVSLVVNAIEASPSGGAVELSCSGGEGVHIDVRDRGPGAPAELLPRLSEPGVSTKPDGTGLGLTLVRALAAQHGGNLQLRNREGGGFVAALELPLRCLSSRCLA